ncbi:MAG: hypothetical protein ACJATI_001056 [Halioglobus sp.]|jgi:hypothetical protein
MVNKTINKSQGLPGTEVYSIAPGNDEIWMSVEGQNICRWNGYKLTCYGHVVTGMDSPSVRIYYKYNLLHIYEDGTNTYRVFDGNEWKEIKHTIDDPSISKEAIFMDSTGILRKLVWNGYEFEKVDWQFQTPASNYFDTNGSDLNYNPINGLLINRKLDKYDTKVIEAHKSLSHLIGGHYLGKHLIRDTLGRLFMHIDKEDAVQIPTHIDDDFRGTVVNVPQLILPKENRFEIFDLQTNKSIGRIRNYNLGSFFKHNEFYFAQSHNGLNINSFNIHYFDGEDEGMVGSTHIVGEDNQGSIWFGGYKTGLSKFQNNSLTILPKYNSRLDNYMTGTVRLDDGSLVFISEDYNKLQIIKDGKITTKEVLYENNYKAPAYDIKHLSNNRIGIGGFKFGIGIVDQKRLFSDTIKTIHHEEGLHLNYVFCLEEDNNNRIWACSQQEGLAVYDPILDKAKTFHIKDDKSNRFGITSLVLDSLDNLWVGSFKGIYLLEGASDYDYKNRDVYKDFKKIPLIPFEGNVTSILQYDSIMIVAAENEIFFINLNQFYHSEMFNAFTYSYKHDLQGSSSEENGMMIDSKDNLWVGTQEGYLQFELNKMVFDTSMIDLYLEEIIVAKNKITFHGNRIELPPENRNFSYKYNIRANPSLRNNIYTYSSLLNSKGDTLFTELYDPLENSNQFFLAPGNYKLIAKTYKNNKLIDTDIYLIHAQSFLSEKLWFWLTLGGLLFLIFVYFQRAQSIKEKQLLEKDLKLAKLTQAQNQTQLQAIISSFNPHFINNSLHWAQSRYSHDKTLVKVIGRLSENIEHIFLKTKKGIAYHTLAEELKLVENYVEIQKVRFKDSFEYHPPNNAEQYANFNIPIMQLQIHVENAIEHGLRNRLESKIVSISINEEASNIIFEIEDDGIGRKGANRVMSQGTQSGTELLSKVHTIINSQNKEKISQKYQDDIFGEYGTRVIVNIPKSINYDLNKV